MMPASPSRDTIGPIARTVRDAALVLDAIVGYDPKDPVTAASYRQIPESYTAFLQPNGLRGMRFGVIRQSMDKQTDTNAADYKEIRAMIDRVVGVLKTRGAEIVDPMKYPTCSGCFKAAVLRRTHRAMRAGGGAAAAVSVEPKFFLSS
jgi:Asp-tRNA(Asn)/Glu-tRNA(Gln) amidotransferase A subunit family amidase